MREKGKGKVQFSSSSSSSSTTDENVVSENGSNAVKIPLKKKVSNNFIFQVFVVGIWIGYTRSTVDFIFY